MKIAFGLDLAGYSTSKSALAMAQRDAQRIVVTVFIAHPLAARIKRRDVLANTVEKERACIQQCCELGALYVDIPIEMQELPYPAEVRYVWQLTHRPVDYAYNAMPAFADRIGAPVS